MLFVAGPIPIGDGHCPAVGQGHERIIVIGEKSRPEQQLGPAEESEAEPPPLGVPASEPCQKGGPRENRYGQVERDRIAKRRIAREGLTTGEQQARIRRSARRPSATVP